MILDRDLSMYKNYLFCFVVIKYILHGLIGEELMLWLVIPALACSRKCLENMVEVFFLFGWTFELNINLAMLVNKKIRQKFS